METIKARERGGGRVSGAGRYLGGALQQAGGAQADDAHADTRYASGRRSGCHIATLRRHVRWCCVAWRKGSKRG
jgi:hypothetical protein